MEIGDKQGTVLGPVLFNNCIRDTDSGIQCSHKNFADDRKLSDKLQKCDHRKFMSFIKTKCKVMYLSLQFPHWVNG